MESDRVLGMFKFGKRQHIEQFAHGLLYMNPLGYFIDQEATSVRSDPHEGTSHMVQSPDALLQVKVEGEFKDVGTIQGAIRGQNPPDLKTNLFCMYALRASVSDTLVDSRNQAFGDTFAVLVQFDDFMRRVKAAVLNSSHGLQYHLVEYVDESSYQGPVGIFRKDSCFAYQSEFRIALLPGTGMPYPLQVGDLSDIIIVGPLSELNQRLRIVQAGASVQ